MTKSTLAAWVVLSTAASVVASAGIRCPGKYCGVVVYDRWDGCTLYSGVYVMYISEGGKQTLRQHAGKCIQIDAKKVRQPINPGDGLISGFVFLGSAPAAGAWVPIEGLALRVAQRFANGERPTIEISIANSGANDVPVLGAELAPTLLAKKGGKEPLFIPSDGPSYALITRQSFRGGPDGEAKTSGRGGVNGQSYGWTLDAAVPNKFILKPGDERVVVISFDLPKGEYDFLAGYGGGVHEGECLASNHVAFDVGDDGKATIVDIKRR